MQFALHLHLGATKFYNGIVLLIQISTTPTIASTLFSHAQPRTCTNTKQKTLTLTHRQVERISGFRRIKYWVLSYERQTPTHLSGCQHYQELLSCRTQAAVPIMATETIN